MRSTCHGYTASMNTRWREITSSDLVVGMTLVNADGSRWIVSRLDPSPAGPLPIVTVVSIGLNHTESWDCNRQPKYLAEVTPDWRTST